MQLRDLVLRVGGYESTDQTFSQAQADAIEAVYQLRSGAPVDSVTEHFGMMDSAVVDRGMQFDFAAKLHLGERLYGVASQLSTGEVSEPVTAPDGIHVIVMLNRQPPTVEEFPQARAQVYSDFSQSRVLQANQANLGILRRQARILVAEDLTE
jgi:parvulin-like peptidyl-prolyl isomerase